MQSFAFGQLRAPMFFGTGRPLLRAGRFNALDYADILKTARETAGMLMARGRWP